MNDTLSRVKLNSWNEAGPGLIRDWQHVVSHEYSSLFLYGMIVPSVYRYIDFLISLWSPFDA